MRTESVKCPAPAVFAKSRARQVHIMSLNLTSTDLNYSINRVSYVLYPRTTDESLHYFVLPFQLYTNFEIRRRVPRVKKIWRNSKSTHASLSLSTCRSADGIFTFICKHCLDPDQTRMVFRQFKNVCIR